LALGDASAAAEAAKAVLAQAATDAGALCALARAHLAEGRAGLAKIFAARAAQADPLDPEPLLVNAEIARTAGDAAGQMAALEAAIALDSEWAPAQLAWGRALYDRS